MTLNTQSFAQLKKCVASPADVSDDPLLRHALAGDASFYRLIPQAVAFPKNTNEVLNLFRWSHQYQIPLVFRASGTSLSGQAITDGVLVDVTRAWKKIQLGHEGQTVKAECGVIGQHLNDQLKKWDRKIGPDPASISSCRLGGIVANNSSGMCCGTHHNSYHTLKALTFILPNGVVIDTSQADAASFFKNNLPELAQKLLIWRERILQNKSLLTQIRRKYQLKNTVGYGLNAFIDFVEPLDIFSHLLVGSEGTLAFIADVTLQTILIKNHVTTAFLLYPSVSAACEAIEDLKKKGAEAIEFLDSQALQAIANLPELNLDLKKWLEQYGKNLTALLIDFSFSTPKEKENLNLSDVLENTISHQMAGSEKQAQNLWKARKMLLPLFAAQRAPATSVVIEDVAFPLAQISAAVVSLQTMLADFGYVQSCIFGHAKDGNLHFIITPNLSAPEGLAQYQKLMAAVVDLVLQKGGSLKAEHGTGRNMAPYVEREWGPEVYQIMWELKQAVDPQNLLNPGVILNRDEQIHLKNIKTMPHVDPMVDQCMECGFCEPQCPTREVTLSPRQRISLMREKKRASPAEAILWQSSALQKREKYLWQDTCVGDGMCAVVCPVQIDTGHWVKQKRQTQVAANTNKWAVFFYQHWRWLLAAAHQLLKFNHALRTYFHWDAAQAFSEFCAQIKIPFPSLTQVPQAASPLSEIKKISAAAVGGAQLSSVTAPLKSVFYFPSCMTRTLGISAHETQGQPDTMQLIVQVLQKYGFQVLIPDGLENLCCGLPFASKGFVGVAQNAWQDWLNFFSSQFAAHESCLGIIVDNSPCTLQLKEKLKQLSQAANFKHSVWDSIEFAQQFILPQVPQQALKQKNIWVHETCSNQKMSLSTSFKTVAQTGAWQVQPAQSSNCCGMGGDKSLWFPQISAQATLPTQNSIKNKIGSFDGYYSCSRTCEWALEVNTGKNFKHLYALLADL